MEEFILNLLEQIPLEDLIYTAVTILGEGLHSLLILLMILGMAFSGLCWLVNQIVKCVIIWCWERSKKIIINFLRNKKLHSSVKGEKVNVKSIF